MSKRVMVFHVPFALDYQSPRASGIRPVKMRHAFESIGYEVLEVSGNHEQRQSQIRNLKRRIKAGLRPDFVYSESATNPTGLGEKVTRYTSWSRDIRFLRFCRRRSIPVGLFYRDIHWVFPEFRQRLSKRQVALLTWRFRSDLRGYRKALDVLFLPSAKMKRYLPNSDRYYVYALPPGAEVVTNEPVGGGIQAIYAGGLGNNYRIHEALRGAELAASCGVNVRFTLCTRSSEWASQEADYCLLTGDWLTVVHESGEGLDHLYSRSNLGLLFVEPVEYWEFAVPVKLFDYIGHGLPVVASEGTLAGEMTSELGVGWTIPYNAVAWANLINQLAKDPSELENKRRRAIDVAGRHTWEARAQEVANVLREIDRH